MPLQRLSEEIQGEIYKKRIYISKHCEEHFKTLSARFNLARNQPDEIIFNKIEEHFNREYNKFGWMWPITKDDQARLGICFTVQMHQKGTFIVFIKKNFKDIETFLEHYYRVFDFLDYEEHGRLMDLFRIQKEDRKLFDYIHLVNKVGPKKTIDKDFKGSHIKVEYFTLQSGKKAINVKIDYSDPHEPELEFEGPEAQSRNLRDILVKPSNTLPTIDNIGKWSLDARNNAKDIKFQNERIIDNLESSGQAIQLIHQDTISYVSEVDAHLNNIELQSQIQHKDLTTKLKQIKREFPQLKELFIELSKKNSKENIELRKHLANTLVGVMNLQVIDHEDHEQILNQIEHFFLESSNKMDDEFQGVHGAINGAKEEIVQTINDRFDSLKDLVSKEFENVKSRIKNSLYLILRKLDRVPGMTARELSEVLKVSLKTVYSYLKKLQENEIILSEKKKSSGRGRPARSFTLNLKKLLKMKDN